MHRTPLEASPERLDSLRRRSVRALFSGVALGSTGYIAAVTVGTIVARDLTGSSLLSGAPGAAVVLGAAGGAALLSRLMIARGRRFGLTSGYVISVVGAFIATAAVVGRAFPLLLLGTLLIGFGNASNQLSRYAAADLYPVVRRASAIGLVVWGATVGAVVGPNLIGLAGTIGGSFGLPPLAGAYLLPIIFVGLAGIVSFVLLRPDPYRLADQSDVGSDDGSTATSLRRIFARPNVPIAIVALITVQVVMVLIMTMTPLHMTEHGHDLAAVGIVISGHTFGMFALSPLSGRLTDRFGSYPIVLAGLFVTAGSGILSALAPADGGTVLFVALFLLGFGWNLGFVAGSALLTVGLGLSERTRIQGLADALIWSSAAAASLSSGVVVAAAGYATLGLLGAALVIVPSWLLINRARTSQAPAD
jgi:MFS family permease